MGYDAEEELAKLHAETERRKKELEALQKEELRKIREMEKKGRTSGTGYSPELDSAFLDETPKPKTTPQQRKRTRPVEEVEDEQPVRRTQRPKNRPQQERPQQERPQPRARQNRTFDPDQAVSEEEYLDSFDDDYTENSRSKRSGGKKSGGRNVRDDGYDKSNVRNFEKNKKKKKKKNRGRRIIRNIIIVILVIFLIFGLAVWNVTRKFNKIDTEVSGRADSMKHKVINILLVGQDARDGQEAQRSDSMIVLSINQSKNSACMISFMRDTYVDIPGYGGNRLNAAYAYGGFDLLDQTIEQNFGITIDGNMMVDFNGFLDAMSAIGSLKMDLTAEEAAYMNENPALGSNNDVSDEVWDLTEGENKLTPSQILCYSRMRYVGNSDWDRTERQRKVIAGVISQVKHGHLIRGYKVANNAAPSITTDLSSFGMMRMVSGLVTSGETESYIVPVEGTYYADTINGMAVLVPDLAANQAAVQSYINGEATESSDSE